LVECLALRGDVRGVDTSVITEIAEYMQEECGQEVPSTQPFVGRDFNLTRAGVHADGVLKDEEIYNIFGTGKLLKRPPRVRVSATSGTAGVAYWINSYLELRGEDALGKRTAGILKIAEWVRDQYAKGRVSDLSEAELIEQGRKPLPEYFDQQAAD
jgi:isopropylmalate/homocitrate/citramalate synthase